MINFWGLGIGDWGLGIGPNPHCYNFNKLKFNNLNFKIIFIFKTEIFK